MGTVVGAGNIVVNKKTKFLSHVAHSLDVINK